MGRSLRRYALANVLLAGAALLALVPVRGDGPTPGASAVSDLFLLVFALALIIGVVVEGLIIAAILLFRKREGQFRLPARVKTKDFRLEFIWTFLPILVIAAVAGASFATFQVTEEMPEPDFTVQVVAHQFFFEFIYPDNTSVDNVLRVEADRVVRLEVTSTDVIHSFFVKDFLFKIDAVPGRVNVYWFQAEQVGSYIIQCAEYCGAGHYGMEATLDVFPVGSQALPYGPSS